MMLYIVRSGQAVAPTGARTDAERPLTHDGAERMRDVAHALRLVGVLPDVILTSPLARAEETADILQRELGERTRLETCAALSPGHDAAEVMEELSRWRVTSAVIVGHEAQLAELISMLLTGTHGAAVSSRDGSVTCIECDGMPCTGRGTIAWHITPAIVRSLLGPRHSVYAA